jgi:probable phosphoglycerate mutase
MRWTVESIIWMEGPTDRSVKLSVMDEHAKFEVVLMRHGQTEWSRSGRHTGRSDLPLTAVGEDEAAAMQPHIAAHEYELVLTSPLVRASRTCEIVGLGHRAENCEDLREWDYGDYEGLTSAEIRRDRPTWDLWRDGCPGGESPDRVGARCDRVINRLLEASRVGAGDAIVFAHGHILRALAARWCDLPIETGRHLLLSTAAVSSLSFEHATPVVKFWNRTSQDR